MYQVEDEPIETIHLYVVREGEPRPSYLPVILSVLALSILIAIGVLTPYQQPEQRASIRVPAVPLIVRTFYAPIVVMPTGIKTYPATYAHGFLTFSNGSIIGQSVPVGYVIDGAVTDRAVYVPAATASGFGVATVPAHLLTSGINIQTLAINEVIGSSLFVRNLEPFTGGRPAYSVKFATPQDRQVALVQARQLVRQEATGLHYPCSETITNVLTWRCQFVTYKVPPYMRVLAAHLVGRNFLVDVVFVARPERVWVK